MESSSVLPAGSAPEGAATVTPVLATLTLLNPESGGDVCGVDEVCA